MEKEQLELENKVKTLEKENTRLRLEKSKEEIIKQITDDEDLIKTNFKTHQRLKNKEIIKEDDISYLKNNKILEERVKQWKKELFKIEKEMKELETTEKIIEHIEQTRKN